MCVCALCDVEEEEEVVMAVAGAVVGVEGSVEGGCQGATYRHDNPEEANDDRRSRRREKNNRRRRRRRESRPSLVAITIKNTRTTRELARELSAPSQRHLAAGVTPNETNSRHSWPRCNLIGKGRESARA